MSDTSDTTFMQRQTAKLPPFWKMKVIRCGIYAIVVGADAFDTGVEGFDSFAMMTSMQIGKLLIHIAVAMLTVWVAFLDQTMGSPPPPSGQLSINTATKTTIENT